jgi:hypothetical protein
MPSPSATSAPSSAPSAAPTPSRGSGSDRSTDTGNGNGANNGKHKGQIKKIKTVQLSRSQVQYGLTHLPQQVVKLRAMKKVKFSQLGIYRLTAADKSALHVSDAAFNAIADALYGGPALYASTTTMIAQTSGNSTATNLLHNVLANINVSDALNNVLNNSTVDVNANVSLQDVLNNVNVGIGQVVGIYIGTGGSVTTIVGG